MSNEFIKFFDTDKKPQIPSINAYKIERDVKFLGYKVRLAWTSDFDQSKILGFKIWKSNSPVVMLDKEYVITQASLERLTGIKTFYAQNNVLYNKIFFSQNSKVKFFDSNSNRFDKINEEENLLKLQFSQIDFVDKNEEGLYEFTDKNVKFGETYYYAISLVTTSFFETSTSAPVRINIEDLEFPDPPKFEISESPNGAILFISTNVKSEDVVSFDVYRREENEETFEKVANVLSEGNNVSFIDSTTIPGKKYYYKVYSVDFFGNVSRYSNEKFFTFDSIFSSKKDSLFPSFKISSRDGVFYINLYKNSEDIVGYKIERKDVWKFDNGYEIKEYNYIPWPNVNFFDQNGIVEFIDRGVSKGRTYSYRVTSVRKNGVSATYWVTPPLEVSDEIMYEANIKAQIPEPDVFMSNFSIDILDSKQFPIYAKLEWETTGNWTHGIIYIEKYYGSNNSESIETLPGIRVDSIHKFIYLDNLEDGYNYNITMNLFDKDDNLVFRISDENSIKVSL